MASKTNYKDLESFNNWMEEFKVSSRYVKPIGRQDRHYFDSRFYIVDSKKSSTFYFKFVSIIKSIF